MLKYTEEELKLLNSLNPQAQQPQVNQQLTSNDRLSQLKALGIDTAQLEPPKPSDSSLDAFTTNLKSGLFAQSPAAAFQAAKQVLPTELGLDPYFNKKIEENRLQAQEYAQSLTPEAQQSIPGQIGSFVGESVVPAIGLASIPLTGGATALPVLGGLTAYDIGGNVEEFEQRRAIELENKKYTPEQIRQTLDIEGKNVALESIPLSLGGTAISMATGGLGRGAKTFLGGAAKSAAVDVIPSVAEAGLQESVVSRQLDAGADEELRQQKMLLGGVLGTVPSAIMGGLEARKNANLPQQETQPQVQQEVRNFSLPLPQDKAQERLAFLQKTQPNYTFELAQANDANGNVLNGRNIVIGKRNEPLQEGVSPLQEMIDAQKQRLVNNETIAEQPTLKQEPEQAITEQSIAEPKNKAKVVTPADMNAVDTNDIDVAPNTIFEQRTIPRRVLNEETGKEQKQDIDIIVPSDRDNLAYPLTLNETIKAQEILAQKGKADNIVPIKTERLELNELSDANTYKKYLQEGEKSLLSGQSPLISSANKNIVERIQGKYSFWDRAVVKDDNGKNNVEFLSTINISDYEPFLSSVKNLKDDQEVVLVREKTKDFPENTAVYVNTLNEKTGQQEFVKVGRVERNVAKELAKFFDANAVDNVKARLAAVKVPYSGKSDADKTRQAFTEFDENGKEVKMINRTMLAVKAELNEKAKPVIDSLSEIKKDKEDSVIDLLGEMEQEIVTSNKEDADMFRNQQRGTKSAEIEKKIVEKKNTELAKEAKRLEAKKQKEFKQKELAADRAMKKEMKFEQKADELFQKQAVEIEKENKKLEEIKKKLEESKAKQEEINRRANKDNIEEDLRVEKEQQKILEEEEKASIENAKKLVMEEEARIQAEKKAAIERDIAETNEILEKVLSRGRISTKEEKEAVLNVAKSIIALNKDKNKSIEVLMDFEGNDAIYSKEQLARISELKAREPNANGFIEGYETGNMTAFLSLNKILETSKKNNASFEDTAKFVYTHEVLGHGAINTLFKGAELEAFIDFAYAELNVKGSVFKELFDNKALTYKREEYDSEDAWKKEVTEEVLADMANGKVKLKVGDKYVIKDIFTVAKEFAEKNAKTAQEQASLIKKFYNTIKDIFSRLTGGKTFKEISETKAANELAGIYSSMKSMQDVLMTSTYKDKAGVEAPITMKMDKEDDELNDIRKEQIEDIRNLGLKVLSENTSKYPLDNEKFVIEAIKANPFFYRALDKDFFNDNEKFVYEAVKNNDTAFKQIYPGLGLLDKYGKTAKEFVDNYEIEQLRLERQKDAEDLTEQLAKKPVEPTVAKKKPLKLDKEEDLTFKEFSSNIKQNEGKLLSATKKIEDYINELHKASNTPNVKLVVQYPGRKINPEDRNSYDLYKQEYDRIKSKDPEAIVPAFYIRDKDGSEYVHINMEEIKKDKFANNFKLKDYIEFVYLHENIGHGMMRRFFGDIPKLNNFLNNFYNKHKDTEVFRFLTAVKKEQGYTGKNTIAEEILADLSTGNFSIIDFNGKKRFFDVTSFSKFFAEMYAKDKIGKGELEIETLKGFIDYFNDVSKEVFGNEVYSFYQKTGKEIQDIAEDFNKQLQNVSAQTKMISKLKLKADRETIKLAEKMSENPDYISSEEHRMTVSSKIADLFSTLPKTPWLGTGWGKAMSDPLYKPGFEKMSRISETDKSIDSHLQKSLKNIYTEKFGWKSGVSKQEVEVVNKALFETQLNNKRFTADELKQKFNLSDKGIIAYESLIDGLHRGQEIRAMSEILYKAVKSGVTDDDFYEKFRNITERSFINFQKEISMELSNRMSGDSYAKFQEFLNKKTKEAKIVVDYDIVPTGKYYVYVKDKSGKVVNMKQFSSKFQAQKFKVREEKFNAKNGFTVSLDKTPIKIKDRENERLKFNVIANEYKRHMVEQYTTGKTTKVPFDYYRGSFGIIDDVSKNSSLNIHLAPINRYIERLKQDGEAQTAQDLEKTLEAELSQDAYLATKARNFNSIYNLGGSVASGFVNLLSLPTVVWPYLSRYEGYGSIANLSKLLGQISTDTKVLFSKDNDELAKHIVEKYIPAEYREKALIDVKRLIDSGILMDTSDYQLSKVKDGVDLTGKFQNIKNVAVTGFMMPFAKSEMINRTVTGIAALNIAYKNNKNGFDFTKETIYSTQGYYDKIGRPVWARNSVGQLLYQFKTYPMNYVELLIRLAAGDKKDKTAAGAMVAILFLLAGAKGMPLAEDTGDIIDTARRVLGDENANIGKEIEDFIVDMVGKENSGLFLYGAASEFGLPFNLQQRLSMNNIIPGTRLLDPAVKDKTTELKEIGGPTVSNTSNILEAIKQYAKGEYYQGTYNAAPSSIKGFLQGGKALTEGNFTDKAGRIITTATTNEGILRLLGFQPSNLAEVYRGIERMEIQKQNVSYIKSLVYDLMADAKIEGNPEKRAVAKRIIDKFNQENPGTKLVIDEGALTRRINDRKNTLEDRYLKQLPKELRKEFNNL